jgi:glyoxylase-like metal-dependent hydrolase (beta-lactamase superfamily II)
VYALDSARGPVLIDAGWEHPEAWTALRDGLAGLGLSVADVYGVVVTHHHPDHAGLAGRVREASGAWIAMHHADAEVVRQLHQQVRDGIEREWQSTALRRAGAGPGELAEAGQWDGRVDPPAVPDRELADGDLVDLPGRALRAIWTPGHSPGHICLHLPAANGTNGSRRADPAGRDRLFTGDHVLPRITPHIGLYPYDRPGVDPLGDYIASLNRILAVDVDEAMPAHEHRFSDFKHRVHAIIAHHEERLAEVAALLSAEPRTLWEISAGMRWNQSWEAMRTLPRRMAAGEAASHLRTLERRGAVRRFDDKDPIRFVRQG